MGNDVSKGRVLTVDGTSIKVQKLLGEGGFAQVFLATLLDDGGGRDVVLKRMRVSVDGESAPVARLTALGCRHLSHQWIRQRFHDGSLACRR